MLNPAESEGTLLRRLRKLSACTVSDALDALDLPGATTGILPVWGYPKIVGRAVTTLTSQTGGTGPPRHLAVAAIARAGRHSVIVIDAQGDAMRSAWGGLLSRAAALQGAAGAVIFGGCRDVDEARMLEFPVFAMGVVTRTARGRTFEVSHGEPVRCGDAIVWPGDFVIADSSGVVFVEQAKIGDVLACGEHLYREEASLAARLKAGEPVINVLGTPEFERATKGSGLTDASP